MFRVPRLRFRFLGGLEPQPVVVTVQQTSGIRSPRNPELATRNPRQGIASRLSSFPMIAGTRRGSIMRISRYTFVSLVALVALAVPLAAQVNDTYVIPAAGNNPGANGTHWATQFSLFNPQAYKLTVSVTFVPTGGAQGIEKLIDVPANATVFSDNLLSDLYNGRTGSGALLVATFPEDNLGVTDSILARAFLVTTNTFNDARTGTFGQSIPGIWTGLQDYNSDGITAVANGIRNRVQGWRTNIGAVNLGRYSVTLRVSVYDGSGNTLASQLPFILPPQGHFQDALPTTVDRGSIEFSVDDPKNDTVTFAYASVIDPLSGDPTYVNPVLLASPTALFGQKTAAGRLPTATSSVVRNPFAEVGRKIDTGMARFVRMNAEHLGSAQLGAEASGYRILQ